MLTIATICGIIVIIIATTIMIGCIWVAHAKGLNGGFVPSEIYKYGGLLPGVIGYCGYHLVQTGEIPFWGDLSWWKVFLFLVISSIVSNSCIGIAHAIGRAQLRRISRITAREVTHSSNRLAGINDIRKDVQENSQENGPTPVA